MKAMPADRLAGSPRIHLVGVGGIGVSALAELLAARGCRVTGTDRADSERVRTLRGLGVEVHVGDDPALAAGADLVVYTSAAGEDHPERAAAREGGVPQYPRGAALAALVAERRGVGIAGAHGKTTTTAILAQLLEGVGADPSAAVGGVVDAWNSPVRRGDGELFVAEADESDRSFLALELSVALALNVDADHLENYEDFDELKACYREFLGRAAERAVVWIDDPTLAAAAGAWTEDEPVLVTVGTGEDAQYRVGSVAAERGGVGFDLARGGDALGRFYLPRPGAHNAANAACALAVCLSLGFEPDPLREALVGFGGVDRRYTLRGHACGVEVRDDYAHMPAEVAATLEAAHGAHEGRVVAVFQPHLYSRTQAHAAEFGEALAAADVAFVLPIYGAREEPVEGVDGGLVTASAPSHVNYLPAADLEGAAHQLAGELKEGDLVLTLGAGSVTGLGRHVLDELWRRRLAGRLPSICPEHWLDEPLARFNSFQTGGAANLVAKPGTLEELQGLVRELAAVDMPFKVFGGGTNLLVGDGGVVGAVIVLGAGFQGFEVLEEGPDGRIRVEAGAALTTGKLFRRLYKEGVGGFEWFHHVPGTLGGAIVNNSGAYGQDLRGHLLEYQVLGRDGSVEWRPASALAARYRWTALKGRDGEVVLAARLAGPKKDPEEIMGEAKRQAAQRNATQPGGKGSVGCAFKNPTGGSAGKLIDEAGLKGRRRGGAQVSEKHGNFILNAGAASAADIIGLAEEVRAEVRRKFGVDLEYEIERVGRF